MRALTFLKTRVTVVVACGLTLSAVGLLRAQAGRTAVTRVASTPASGSAVDEYRQMLDRYCVTCHNQRQKTAGLLLDQADLAKVPEGAATWEKVHRKLRDGAMPPLGSQRPPQEKLQQFASWLEHELDTSAFNNPRPGRPTIHRLNRTEYVNIIRDVLDLNVDGASLLPADDVAYGFDNIGDVLSTSPTLMERYLAAAQKVSRLATGDVSLPDDPAVYSVSLYLRQDERMGDALPFGSRGGLSVRHRFVVDGEYELRVRLQQLFDSRIRGLKTRDVIDVFIDGERVRSFPVGGLQEYTAGEFNADAGLNIRLPIKAGERTVAVAFPKRQEYREAPLEPMPALTTFAQNYVNFEPAIDRLHIDGPYNTSAAGDTPSRRAIFTCRPRTEADDRVCADQILTRMATRLYRRPAGAKDLQILGSFYQDGRKRGGFEEGIRTALARMLVDPQFLFRFEREPASASTARVYRVADMDLASRLSFFLWSSGPDDALLAVARNGTLHQPAVLEREVRRMLADPRSHALVSNFAAQWLWLRNLSTIQPNPKLFPEWDDSLRKSLQRETELFLESMIKADQPVQDLLTAKYTFVNERLAAYYGMPKVYGSHFRRVTVTDPKRQGLLGQGSILAVTSYDDRTSSVKRGNWLLENILGAPSPPPPPNVPSLPEQDAKGKVMTMRERMAVHRKNPVCASCHTRIDPLGFALEVFDGIGQARTTDGGNPIETAGALPNGAKFNDIAELRELLVRPPDQFVEAVTHKLLTYALGRGVEYSDQPFVRQVTRDAKADGFRWSSIVIGIVKSVPFQMREPLSATPAQPVAAAAVSEVPSGKVTQ